MYHSHDVCGLEHVKLLDNKFRKTLQNPQKMFGHYLSKGSTVIDIGCGPGVLTLELAKMVGSNGKVIAIDLQQEMLELAKAKIVSAGLHDRVTFHQCSSNSLNFFDKADFIVTFYMVHETPSPLKLIDQIISLLKPNGIYYLAEPKFHVTKKQYFELIDYGKSKGLSVLNESGIISRIAVFQKR